MSDVNFGNFYEIGEIEESAFGYVVIVSRYRDKWVWCKNEARKGWELPGGRIEAEESPLAAAKRELHEETGAVKFDIRPVCVYSAKWEQESFGMLYFAEIAEFGDLPDSEIDSIGFFDDIPAGLTFPLVHPKLLKRVEDTV